jgi:hypothetical protein
MLLRPFLLTILAVCLVGVATWHARDPKPKAEPPCANAQALRDQGFYAEAHAGYATLLKEDAPPTCATDGLETLTKKECARADALVAASPADAAKAYRAILDEAPATDAAMCARDGLAGLPAAAKAAKSG